MKNNDLTYEKAIKELEEILEDLENDNLSLNESLEKFKRGIALYNHCNEILNHAEGEIKILLKDEEGSFQEEDFDMEV